MSPISNMHRFNINIPKGRDESPSRNNCTKTRSMSGETWNPVAHVGHLWFIMKPSGPQRAWVSPVPSSLLTVAHSLSCSDSIWCFQLSSVTPHGSVIFNILGCLLQSMFHFHSFTVIPQDLFRDSDLHANCQVSAALWNCGTRLHNQLNLVSFMVLKPAPRG